MSIDIKRGDIIDVDLLGAEGVEKKNDFASGARPCIVIQNDVGNEKSPMTIIAPLTGMDQFKWLPVQVAVTAQELGSGGSDSVVELGHIRSIDRNLRIRRHLGRLADEAMARVDRAIAVSLGLSTRGYSQNA